MRWLLLLIFVAGCPGEPDYEGLRCDESAPCPGLYRCADGRCTLTVLTPPDAGDAGTEMDVGVVDAGESDSGEADAGEPDAGPADTGPMDVGPGDTGPEDMGTPDAGTPCDAPVTYPAVGWEVRHFEIDGNFDFTSCIGLETITTEDIDITYGPNGPLGGPITDFGSRYTATRTFEEGIYTFPISHDDGLRIYIDGNLIYDVWEHGLAANRFAHTSYLAAGDHTITVEHFDDEGFAAILVQRVRGCQGLPVTAGDWTLTYHGLDPATLTSNDHCYGFETITAATLTVSGVPTPLANRGVNDDYLIEASTLQTFPGETDLAVTFYDGIRTYVEGVQVADEWTRSTTPRASPVTRYLAPDTPRALTVEKFVSGNPPGLTVSFESACDRMPSTGLVWDVRYYPVIYVAMPESWTLDRTHCLGVDTIATDQLMVSGNPPVIVTRGLNALWGADYLGTRTYPANTPITFQYDDGIRVYNGSGPTPVYEDWTAPQVDSDTLLFGAGTHIFQLEYFQNFGGTQINATW